MTQRGHKGWVFLLVSLAATLKRVGLSTCSSTVPSNINSARTLGSGGCPTRVRRFAISGAHHKGSS